MPTLSPRVRLGALLTAAVLLAGCSPLNAVDSQQTAAEACAQLQKELTPLLENADTSAIESPADAAKQVRETATAINSAADKLGNAEVKKGAQDMAKAMNDMAAVAATLDPSKMGAAMGTASKVQKAAENMAKLCPDVQGLGAPGAGF